MRFIPNFVVIILEHLLQKVREFICGAIIYSNHHWQRCQWFPLPSIAWEQTECGLSPG